MDALRKVWTRVVDAAKASPAEAALVAAAIAAALYVIVYPFTVVRYPPITDLPFHAANTSILRNYFSAEYHFSEQFLIRPLDAPYFSMYLVGAFFALFMPIAQAAKLMAIVMLALLPAGLAVLFHGMKKSPLLGVLALGLVWNTLSHWGFLSFLGAVGLFAMVVGFTLLVLDEPTRRRQIGLGVALLAVFFTHIYRFPFAVGAVALTALVMYPATRRYKPLLWPVAPALGLFVLWIAIRSHVFAPTLQNLTFDTGRFSEIPGHLFGGFRGAAGKAERGLGTTFVMVALGVATLTTVLFFRDGRGRDRSPAEVRWGVGVTVLPLLLAVGFVLAYLTLPLMAKSWFFVYPREITTAVFIALAAIPDLPRAWTFRAPAVLAVVLAAGRMGFFVANEWHGFHQATADFRAIQKKTPKAPRLFYLVFDHTDHNRSTTPFIHLPAWIQAETGGSLYFHFVRWGLYPIRYNFGSEHVPPTLPHMMEWQPQRFRVLEHGPWFDTFLVRHHLDPHLLFAEDPSMELTAREGKWWLYQRKR